MISFQNNLESVRPARLVWKGVENAFPEPEATEKVDKSADKKIGPQKLESFAPTNLPDNPGAEPGQPEALADAEKKLDQAYEKAEDPKAAIESREIPAELQKMSRAQIRNLERKDPDKLLKICFWMDEGENKLTPITNSGELKAGDKVRFSVKEANGKNKNLEMGAGLRTLPGNIKVVEIGGEKFFRVSEGGPFVDKNGEYRAVRSHENETITLLAESPEDKKAISGMADRRKEFVRDDVGFALDDFLAKSNLTLTPDSVDKFLAEMQNDKTASPEMKNVAKEQAESIKKFAELWKDFNIATYKQGIASIESSGGDYNADNHGRGANDTWNKRAIGKYQFTVETLNGMDVPIKNEADIAAFKQNHQLQEEIMDRFTSEHISRVRDNPNVVAQIGKGAYSVDQVLGAMHLGGAGALRKVERGQLGGTDYMGTSYANYMNRLKQPGKAA